MSIYTGNGDLGKSSLVDGKERSKDGLEFETLGKLDEFQALLYVCLTHLPSKENLLEEIAIDIQKVNSYIAGFSETSLDVQLDQSVHQLEKVIDALEAEITPLEGFVSPKDTSFSVHVNLARVKAREAERILVTLFENDLSKTEGAILKYINRVSDYLFMLMLA